MYEFWRKTWLIKGNITPESSRALEARVTTLEAKSENSNYESLFVDVKPNRYNRNNQHMKERETAPDRAMQMSDH